MELIWLWPTWDLLHIFIIWGGHCNFMFKLSYISSLVYVLASARDDTPFMNNANITKFVHVRPRIVF